MVAKGTSTFYLSAINHRYKQGSHASRPCVRASFLPTMAKNSFRDARTPHCGDAHNAPLNPAPAPSICRLRLLNHSRKEGCLPPAPRICAYLRLWEKSEPPRAILLRKQRRREKTHCQAFMPCNGLSLNLTTLSYRSARKKDFAERFFAKRSGERFKRTVLYRTVANGAPPRRAFGRENS